LRNGSGAQKNGKVAAKAGDQSGPQTCKKRINKQRKGFAKGTRSRSVSQERRRQPVSMWCGCKQDEGRVCTRKRRKPRCWWPKDFCLARISIQKMKGLCRKEGRDTANHNRKILAKMSEAGGPKKASEVFR